MIKGSEQLRAPIVRLLLLFIVASTLIWVAPANAKCHIATWDSDRVSVQESAGEVELPIELDGTGEVTCTGSVRWTTRDGSAVSPADYKGGSGEVKWQRGSPRRQIVRIPIVEDTLAEAAGQGGGQTFHVTMTAGPGGIQVEEPGPGEGGPTVSVLIVDNDKAAATSSPSPTLTPTPTPTLSETAAADTGGGGSAGLIVGVLAGAIVLGILAALMLRRRGAQ